MLRSLTLIAVLFVSPALASAQPCTTDARRVVDEIYRHMLERGADPASQALVDRLNSGNASVRDIVRFVARSPEHTQRFYNRSENDAEYRAVQNLYRHILGRAADEQGARDHAELARSRGIAAAVDALINSPEYAQQFGDWGVPGSGGLRYCGSDRASGGVSQSRTDDLGIVLFREAGYRGRSFRIDDQRRAYPRFNAYARSVQVNGGSWELCEQSNFRGRCAIVTSDVDDLRSLGLGNFVGSVRARQTTRY